MLWLHTKVLHFTSKNDLKIKVWKNFGSEHSVNFLCGLFSEVWWLSFALIDGLGPKLWSHTKILGFRSKNTPTPKKFVFIPNFLGVDTFLEVAWFSSAWTDAFWPMLWFHTKVLHFTSKNNLKIKDILISKFSRVNIL